MPVYLVISEYINQYPYNQMGIKRILRVIETTLEETRDIDLSEWFSKGIPISVEYFTREVPNPIQEFNNGKSI